MSSRIGSLLSTLVLLLVVGCAESVDVPAVDYSGMEPQVVEKIEASRKAVMDDPESASTWGDLGMDFHAHTLYAEAAQCYVRAAEIDPGDYRWSYLAGVCTARLDPAQALPLFEQAATMNPSNPGFHIRFGDLLTQSGDHDRAAESYRAALAVDSRLSHALYGLGLLALRAGDLDQARSHLERAAEAAPHHGEVHKLLAQVYQRLDEPELAELSALSARAYPDESGARDSVIEQVNEHAVSSRSHSQRGLALAQAGRYAEAETVFRKVMELREANARDYANLGGSLAGQGRLDEAIEAYQEALRITPEETYARNNLALALLTSGDAAAAEEHLREALRIDPAYADAHFNLGLLLERTGRPEQAEGAYRQALAVNPAHAASYNSLARLLAIRGDETGAMALWRKTVSINALDLDAMYNLAMLLSKNDEHAEAIGLLNRAMQLAPNSSLLAQALAAELATAPDAELRDGPRAVELASRVYEQYPDRPEAGNLMAAALAETGEFERAIEVARQAMRQARDAGRMDIAKEIQLHLEGYYKKQPARQRSASSPTR